MNYTPRLTLTLRDEATPALVELTGILRRLAWFLKRNLDSHRTGHRHRGERLWRTRYVAGRRDLPLGMRTAAKLRV